MKKYIFVLFALLLFVSMFSVFVNAASVPEGYKSTGLEGIYVDGSLWYKTYYDASNGQEFETMDDLYAQRTSELAADIEKKDQFIQAIAPFKDLDPDKAANKPLILFAKTVDVVKRIVIGTTPAEVVARTNGNQFSGGIVMIMMWLIIFVTFFDILSTFSSFGKSTSWLVSLGLAVIAAQVGFINSVFLSIVGVFVWLGAGALFVGLLGAFFAFAVVNLGIWKAGGWLMKRQELMKASKGNISKEKHVEKLKGTIEAMDKLGDALSK